MKIAVLASSIHPVKQCHLLDWYRSIQNEIPDIELFIGSKSPQMKEVKTYKINSKIQSIQYKIENWLYFKKTPREAFKISPLFNFNPDVIQLLTSQSFNTIKPILANDKIKLIVSFRGFDLNIFPHQSQINLQLTQEIFERANVLHFVCEDLKSKALALGADPDKCIVINRSFDINQFENIFITEKETSLEHIIFTVGRLVWEKGYIYGLEALFLLKIKGYNFKYFIAGDGPDKNLLIHHINRLGLKNEVVLLGERNRKEIFELFSKVTIYLQPSISEGFCNTIMEASYFSLPTAAFGTGGINEIVQHNQTGLLSPTCDVVGLANDIQTLMDQPGMRAEMGKNAKENIINNYSREKEISKWLELYKKVKVNDLDFK